MGIPGDEVKEIWEHEKVIVREVLPRKIHTDHTFPSADPTAYEGPEKELDGIFKSLGEDYREELKDFVRELRKRYPRVPGIHFTRLFLDDPLCNGYASENSVDNLRKAGYKLRPGMFLRAMDVTMFFDNPDVPSHHGKI